MAIRNEFIDIEIPKWLSLSLAMVSLIIVVYVKAKWHFESGNFAAALLTISLISAVLALILGVGGLPKRVAFLTLGIVAIWAFLFFFTRLYVLA
ncbi:MAG: hypothetical protein IPM63_07700 [Acidobacteriota bacterium]|nr:MAG: hypothetical protein IPM63_07700 [Acidobacteriota bacterium]